MNNHSTVEVEIEKDQTENGAQAPGESQIGYFRRTGRAALRVVKAGAQVVWDHKKVVLGLVAAAGVGYAGIRFARAKDLL